MFLQNVMEGNRPSNETTAVSTTVTGSERDKKRSWSVTAAFPQHLYKPFCQHSAAAKGYRYN